MFADDGSRLGVFAALSAAFCAAACADVRETAFMVAVPKDGEVVLDGALSEDCWKKSVPCRDYYDYNVKSLVARVDSNTSCRVLYAPEGIYAGVELRGLDVSKGMSPADIRRNTVSNRDTAIHSDDMCELFFDPACAGISYYRWMINANAKYLATWCMDVSNITLDWDAPPGVKIAAKILDDGWSAEFFAPWNVFGGRTAAQPGDVWGFAHRRTDHAFKRTLGKTLKCGNAPRAGWLWPDQFAFLYFSPGGVPSENEMEKLISSHYSGDWAVRIGDRFMVKDKSGFHEADLMAAVRRREQEKAAAKKALDDLFAGKPAKPWPLPLAGKYPLGRPETKNGFDGSWRYNVDPAAFKTPHLQWAQDRSASPRILFLTDFGMDGGVRDMVEYTARFACEPLFLPGQLGEESTYAKHLTLSSPEDRASHLETLLAKNPDVLVIDGFNASTITTNYLYEIFRRVRDCGLGVLVMNEGGSRVRPFAGLAKKIARAADGLHHFGKGCIKFVDLPIPEWTPEWKAAYESRHVLINDSIECVLNGAPPSRLLVEADETNAVVSLGGVDCDSVEVRVRDAWNEIVRTGSFDVRGGAKTVALSMAELPGGDYWIDVIAKRNARTESVSSTSVPHGGAIGRVQIGARGAAEVVFDEGASADIPVSWERGAGDAVRVVCELSDRPYGNVRRRVECEVPKGAAEAVCRFGSEPFPTLSGDMDVKVYAADSLVGRGRRVVYFPSRRHEIYPMVSWGGSDAAKLPELLAPQLVERLGYRNALAWRRGNMDSAFNARSVPYSTRVQIFNNGKRGCEWKGGLLAGAGKKLRGDASPYNPVARQLIAQSYRRTVAKAAPFRPLAWSFGDECEFGYDLGIGAESDKTAFPAFLKEKYGTVASYNHAHGTAIADFSEAVHKTVLQSLADDDLVSWLDNVQHSERMYADMYRLLSDLVHEADPGALTGAEGSPAGDLERIVSVCDFWGPYRNLVENELLRNIAPDNLRTIWLGGYVDTNPRDGFPEHQWEFLLTGVVNGEAWFSITPGSCFSCLSGDFSIAPYAMSYMPHIERLRRGVAQLLVKTPVRKERFAAYYSHASRHLASAREGLKSPMSGLEDFILFSYRNGFDSQIVTARTLEKLKDLKVLFLGSAYALSDAEVEAFRAFVERGGVIAANGEPGMWDGFLAKRAKPPMSGLWREFDFARFASDENGVRGFLAEHGIKAAANVLGLPEDPKISHVDPANPPFKTSDLTQLHPKVIRIRECEYAPGRKMTLVGLKTYPRFVGSEVKVSFGADGFIYEADRGLVARGGSVSVRLDLPVKLYSFFPEEQAAPSVALDRRSVAAGDRVGVDIGNLRKGGVYRLEVRSPSGCSMPGRENVFCFDESSAKAISVGFALSDPPGEYSVVVRDIATGLEALSGVRVGAEH